ncbi:MAG: HD domain-containing protein [Patescibacteria group bacterium]|jgi:uncharacterized protein
MKTPTLSSTTQKLLDIAELEMAKVQDSGHDIDHVLRVYNLALKIAQTEKEVDLEVLESAVILHDIGKAKEDQDSSGKVDHAVVGAEMAKEILEPLGFSFEKIRHVQDCILSHRYRNDYKPQTIEAKILHDADKLETVGAIGLARSFVWVGRHNAKIYKKVLDINEYAKSNLSDGKINGRIMDKSKHSIHINYELKDKFLLEKLYTKKAKKIGKERLKYYEKYLARLDREVLGEI